jgi:hypothetical protein
MYQVRYASDDPYELDRQSYTCRDEVHLATGLHHSGLEPWVIQQVFVDLQRGGMTVCRVICSEREVARLFPLP